MNSDAVPKYDDGPLTRHGILHPVQRGQTLYRIAKAYGITVQELAEVNDLTDATHIPIGTELWIPGATKILDVPLPGTHAAPPAPSGPAVAAASGPDPADAPIQPPEDEHVKSQHSRFIWPVKGNVESRFGVRSGTQHDGIDIHAEKGSPIVAADAGDVLYVGVQRGYGNIVLIRHADNLITVYAHNDSNLVKAGDHVAQGQQVAVLGQTGNATNPHCHFEVRQDRIPRNPLFYLP